jgi:hypothetical protein
VGIEGEEAAVTVSFTALTEPTGCGDGGRIRDVCYFLLTIGYTISGGMKEAAVAMIKGSATLEGRMWFSGVRCLL